jgi:hypothetical protein
VRQAVGLDKVVDFAAMSAVAVEKRGNVVRAAQNVAAKRWSGNGVFAIVHRAMITEARPGLRDENSCKKSSLTIGKEKTFLRKRAVACNTLHAG